MKRNERGKMRPPRKSGRMGWMAGKEHSSGPVIRHISPFFWIAFLANVGLHILKGPVRWIEGHLANRDNSGVFERETLYFARFSPDPFIRGSEKKRATGGPHLESVRERGGEGNVGGENPCLTYGREPRERTVKYGCLTGEDHYMGRRERGKSNLRNKAKDHEKQGRTKRGKQEMWRRRKQYLSMP
ncbi:hypothetical protein NPIL_6451 [Nephila pilipes]|uniref:Uncharacterized protein n=1 Tax=Nephila pilipes TaxID=299642 RepID=A0A8X6Q404_NEPPI|nr:hypothetical protein NPIL_6451 [Nephila pilipes]